MSQRLDRLIHAVLHLPWWVWVLGLVLTVLLGFGLVRAHGAQRWRAVQRDIAACGLETDPVRWVARAPVPDPARQAELRRLLKVLGGKGSLARGWHPAIPGLRTEDEDKQKSARLLASGGNDLHEVEALLDQGPVLLSSLGWITRDGAQLRAMTPTDLSFTDYPGWLEARAVAALWANQAAISDDPLPSLRRLEQWAAACEPGGLLIDTMIGMELDGCRNEILLWLACHGRLPEPEACRWLAEPPHQLRWGADSFAGERCLFAGSFRNLSPFAGLSPNGQKDGSSHFALMPTFHHDLAWGLASLARSEARLRSSTPPGICPRPPFGVAATLSDMAFAGLEESLVTYAESQFSHRTRRIAGLLAVRYRRGEALPADHEALAALLPAGQLDEMTANSPALLYERLAPGRFRLGIAANARPPLIPAGHWNLAAQPRYGSTIGLPSSTKAVEDCRWSYELDLDAVLVPAPKPRPPGG